jgi:baculoviral IAP repeat-containing protein 6
VSEPLFNEPGNELTRGTTIGTLYSIMHNCNIRQATVKWAILEMIKKPPICFKDVIRKHFYLKRKEIKDQCEKWAKEMKQYLNHPFMSITVSKSYLELKVKYIKKLTVVVQGCFTAF